MSDRNDLKRLLKKYKDFGPCPLMDGCSEFNNLTTNEISYRCLFDNYKECKIYISENDTR